MKITLTLFTFVMSASLHPLIALSAETISSSTFFLEDGEHHRWCKYQKEVDWKTDIEAFQARSVARVIFTNNKLSSVIFSQNDETGDWMVSDEYYFSMTGINVRINRTITVIPEDVRDESSYSVSKGHIVRADHKQYSLSTGAKIVDNGKWLPKIEVLSFAHLPFHYLLYLPSSGDGRVCN